MENKDISLAPFYVGQKVVCISTTSLVGDTIKNGREYIITNIERGLCKCNIWLVQVGDVFGYGNGTYCYDCSHNISNGGRLWFKAARFAPIEENFIAISFSRVVEEESKLVSVN